MFAFILTTGDSLLNACHVFVFTGFSELIPNHLLRPFDERELELVICGISSIDVTDWKTHTRLKHCTQETPQVQWFWQVRINLHGQQWIKQQ